VWVMMVILGWMRWHPRMMLRGMHGMMHVRVMLVRSRAGTSGTSWSRTTGHVVMGGMWIGTRSSWTTWSLGMMRGWIVVLVGRTGTGS
jgi:hypothetical protein